MKIELDHMVQEADDGPNTADNAIPVCFECHAEIHSYNDKHPRGTKFRPEELRLHKEEWLRICREQPRELLAAPRDSGVGPLQAMIDEIEYNIVAIGDLGPLIRSGTFAVAAAVLHDSQFTRAISQGSISILDDGLRDAILKAYSAVGQVNQLITASVHQTVRDKSFGATNTQITNSLDGVVLSLSVAREKLLSFLGSESGTSRGAAMAAGRPSEDRSY